MSSNGPEAPAPPVSAPDPVADDSTEARRKLVGTRDNWLARAVEKGDFGSFIPGVLLEVWRVTPRGEAYVG
ncbi:MAG TPA: hypothetical protein VKF62_06795, partial [Planctomycetota bacterium]|nr:hypothetical protein [Planctomycetota bacterium]